MSRKPKPDRSARNQDADADQALVRSLRRIGDDILEEPVPKALLDILRPEHLNSESDEGSANQRTKRPPNQIP